jgi:1-deoxy-D-xylulose-5-phosphate synthase
VEVPLRNIGVPQRFLDHGKRAEVLAECGLTAQDISRSIVESVAKRTDTVQDAPADVSP